MTTVIHDKIEGSMTLKENTDLHGMITGQLNVPSGITLNLHGTCLQNVVVAQGAVVNVHGTIDGDLVNNGGQVHIYGVVSGSIVKNGGITVVAPNAVVGD